jgi:hypothetical protein
MIELTAVSAEGQPCVARFDTPVQGDGLLKVIHKQDTEGVSVAIYALTQHGAKPCNPSCITVSAADSVTVDTRELPQGARIQVILKKPKKAVPIAQVQPL